MDQPSTPSGDLAVGTTVVYAGPGRLKGVSVFGGSATGSVIVYDNATAASGTVLARGQCAASTFWGSDFAFGIICNKGITVVVAGTGAIANVYFDAA